MAAAQQVGRNPYDDGRVCDVADFVELEELWEVDTARELLASTRAFRELGPPRDHEEQALTADGEAARVARQLDRARSLGLAADLTEREWIAILVRFGFACAYCRVTTNLVMDHVVPIVLGGGTTAGNVVPACKRCNAAKGSRSVAMPQPGGR